MDAHSAETLKVCTKCSAHLERSMFCADRTKRDGLASSCRGCMKAMREADPERYRAAARKWQKANRPTVNAAKRRQYWRDPAETRRRQMERYYSDNDRIREWNRQSYERNKEQRLADARAWAAKNPERIRQIKAAWKARNPAQIRADRAWRRCMEGKACPEWADREAMRQVYQEARALRALTGITHHVDHIIPIRHKLVCGLHVANNLQILPATENMRKTNKFEAYCV